MNIDYASRNMIHSAATVTMGAFLTLCREYGRVASDFANLHPAQWRPIMDATLVRSFLAGGA